MKELITRDVLFVKNEDGQMVVSPDAIERIAYIEKEKKKLDKEYKKFKEVLKDGMEYYGLKKVDTDEALITYVEPFEKTVLDTDRLWAEHKDIAFKCQKEQQVKGSVRITVR